MLRTTIRSPARGAPQVVRSILLQGSIFRGATFGRSILIGSAALGAAVLGSVALNSTAAAQPSQRTADIAGPECEALTDIGGPGARLEITRAVRVAAGAAPADPGSPAAQVPSHCLVEGVIERRTGTDGVEYGIGFAVALPDDWNGRFLFQGGGGLNGTVRPPVGGTAAGEVPALARGFAVVSTDSGHRGAVFDASFFADQEASLNFLYRAVGKVTEVAKDIVADYYSREAERSYFVGCSTGGREAMIASQRFPTYFDGIVSGAPAMRTGYSNLGMRWVATSLNRVAPTGSDGRPIGGEALSASDKQLVVDSVLAACDANDGAADGMIFNTRECGFDPADLICTAAQNDRCLSPQQAAAVGRAFAGPTDANGDQVYAGYLYDTGIAASEPGTIPGLLFGAPSPVDPPVPVTEQDVDAEAAAAARDASALGYTHAWTNLSTFSGNGGKLIFYHGVSDPWFSAVDTIDYYGRLSADQGAGDVTEWSRLFLVPGMGHCRGGEAALDEFDMLSAIVEWVENDDEPESVTATGAAFPGRERPLCPYPTYAHYDGSGDPDDAANFVCR